MKKIAVSILCMCLIASWCHCADVQWDGGGFDGKWCTAANWSGDCLPQAADRAILDVAGAQIIIEYGDEFAVNKILGPCYNVASTVTLTATGGTLNNPSYWYIGSKAGGTGILNIHGARVITRDIILASKDGSSGTINVSSGILEITGSNPGTGAYFGSDPASGINNGNAVVNLTGGTLKAGYLNALGSNAVINVAGGQMLIAGDWRTVISGYVQQGRIRGYGAGSNVGIDFDNVNPGMTTVYGLTSIQDALAAAPAAGAFIYVPEGIYNEGQFNIDKSVTLKSIGGSENTVLNLSGNGMSVIADNVVIDGFTIKNEDTNLAYLIRVGKSITNADYPATDFTMQNCDIQTGGVTDGITICFGVEDVEISSCTISGCINGVVVYGGCESVSLYENDVFSNSYGITVLGSAGEIKMLSNGIYGNIVYGVRNQSAVSLDAENNYWGDGAFDNVSGYVDFEPYLVGCTDDRWHLCPPGDINGDCRVDIADLLSITAAWLDCEGLDCD